MEICPLLGIGGCKVLRFSGLQRVAFGDQGLRLTGLGHHGFGRAEAAEKSPDLELLARTNEGAAGHP